MEGVPHTAKINLGVSLGCPLPTYIKEGGGGGRPRRGAPIGRVQLGFPILVGVPFLFQQGRDERSRNGRRKERGAPPPPYSNSDQPMGGTRQPLEALLSFPVWPIKAHYFLRRIPVTLWYSEKYPNHSELFRCPNIAFQYIDLYISTISKLLVMSVISSGTLNNLRYIKSHNT